MIKSPNKRNITILSVNIISCYVMRIAFLCNRKINKVSN